MLGRKNQNKGTLTSPARLSFILKVRLGYLPPSIFIPYHVTVQKALGVFCDLLAITVFSSSPDQHKKRNKGFLICPAES